MKFEEILQEFNIPYITEGHHHCTPDFVQIDCPFCGKDSKKWHMGYSINYGYTVCWRCGQHSLYETLAELTQLPAYQCRKLLSELTSGKVRVKTDEKPKGRITIPNHVRELGIPHIRYLKKRGYNPEEIIKLWNIQGIGLSANLAWRIFIPIYLHGVIVSWTTRSISDDPNVTRYISASPQEESINHKHILYGGDFVRDTIIICEGCFDVWKIGYGAVATLGTGYSTEQVIRMTNYRNRYICFDNEKPAQQRASNLCNILSLYSGETKNVILDSKDPGEATNKEIKCLQKFLK
jgi:hypothetical protein